MVASADDPHVRAAVTSGSPPDVRWYGTAEDADLRLIIDELGPDGAARPARGSTVTRRRSRSAIDGPHNLANAAAAIGVAALAGVAAGRGGRDAWRAFGGVHRRFEVRGEAAGVLSRRLRAQPDRDGGDDRDGARRRAPTAA